MTQSHQMLIYNPVAGSEQAQDYVSLLVERMSQNKTPVLTYATGDAGEAHDMAKKYGETVDSIITLGGDGTLNEVASAVSELSKKPVVGYIPAGTTNDFATGLGMGDLSIEEAVETAVAGKPVEIDLGRCNQRSFLYVAGFGAFTSISYRTPQAKKNMLGKVAYLMEGLKDLNNLESYSLDIESDGEKRHGHYLLGLISNSNLVAGVLNFEKDTDYRDGKFEVTLVKAGFSALDYAAMATEMMNGKTTHPALETFQSAKLHIQSDRPLQWTLDGEEGDESKDNLVEVMHRAVTIRIPEDQLHRIYAEEE